MIRVCGVLFAVISLSATGCSTMNNTQKGALVGGGVGSIVGTAIGAATGNPRTGAVLGAAGGTALGALAGNGEDRREQEQEKAELRQAAANAQAQAAQLGLIDVVNLSRQGVDAGVIVNQIRSTNSSFNLATSDIEYLTQNQVSPTVIRAMQETKFRSPAVRERVIYRESPVYVERPVVPVYGPPVVYGPPAVGFSYSHVRVR